jgi:hypothetical protein
MRGSSSNASGPSAGGQEAEGRGDLLVHLGERPPEEALEQGALAGVAQPAHVGAGPVWVDAADQPCGLRDAKAKRSRGAVGQPYPAARSPSM